jgi:hypothetical protein
MAPGLFLLFFEAELAIFTKNSFPPEKSDNLLAYCKFSVSEIDTAGPKARLSVKLRN